MSVLTQVTSHIQLGCKMEASGFINIFENNNIVDAEGLKKIFPEKCIFLRNELSLPH